MKFIHQPLLGTLEEHAEAGAVCAGISLAPVSPAVAGRFAGIGSDTVINKAEAETALLAVAAAPAGILSKYLAQFEPMAARAAAYVDEAGKLFPLASGDEHETISGMIAAIVGARPRVQEGVLVDADFLRSHLHLVVGLNVAPIVKALDLLDAITAKIDSVEEDVDEHLRQLQALQERARAPESLAEARRRRVSGKAQRVLPGLASELRHMRAVAAETVDRLDRALLAIEGAS